MSRKLVAFFSASGMTARVAARLAETIGADLHEIVPAVPYSDADLDWRDSSSRSSVEMNQPAFRPEIAPSSLSLAGYAVIYVGFPIWWYVAPTIINTFLEAHDLQGKTIVPFATSGGSGMGRTNEHLLPSCDGAALAEGRVFSPDASCAELGAWAKY